MLKFYMKNKYSKTKSLVRLGVLFYIFTNHLISGLLADSWTLLLLSVCCDRFDWGMWRKSSFTLVYTWEGISILRVFEKLSILSIWGVVYVPFWYYTKIWQVAVFFKCYLQCGNTLYSRSVSKAHKKSVDCTFHLKKRVFKGWETWQLSSGISKT